MASLEVVRILSERYEEEHMNTESPEIDKSKTASTVERLTSRGGPFATNNKFIVT